jgi:hypothetical protein
MMPIALRLPAGQCLALCALGIYTLSGGAADWSIDPAVTVRSEYTDNLTLTPGVHEAIWAAVFSPEVKFGRKTETFEAKGELKANVNRYSDSELDTEDYFARAVSTYSIERFLVGLSVDATRDSTLFTELLETGVVSARRQRNRLLVNPSFGYRFTERTTVKVDGVYRDVHYDDTAGTSLTDYDSYTLSATLQHALGARTLVHAGVFYDEFKTDPAAVASDTYGIETGVDHQFSETVEGSVAVGVRSTTSELLQQALVCIGPVVSGICLGQIVAVRTPVEEESTGYIYSGALEKRFETGSLTARISREILPTAVGSLVETDALRLAFVKNVSAVITASLTASVYRSRYIEDFASGNDSRYYTLVPNLTWRLRERSWIEVGYSYSHLKYDVIAEPATRNIAYVAFSYRWPTISSSK